MSAAAAALAAAAAIVPAECQHDDWTVNGRNTPGFGSCSACHKQIFLSVLFERLRLRMVAAVEKAENAGRWE